MRRNPWSRAPRKVILVACEGKKTECIYLEGLRREWRLLTTEVEVVGVGMTPDRVVEKAIRLRERRIEEARRGCKVRYDEVWCVFDRDTHTDLVQARQRASDKGISVALSTPCFEFWYLLHFCYTTRQFSNFDELAPFLKQHMPAYKKNSDYTGILMASLDTAFKNAGLLRQYNQKNGTCCPATDVDRLVKELKALSNDART